MASAHLSADSLIASLMGSVSRCLHEFVKRRHSTVAARMHARGDSQLAERLQEMNRLGRAWRSRCRKVQVTLKQNASVRDEGHDHRIDMRRAGQRIELQRLLSLAEHVFRLEERE